MTPNFRKTIKVLIRSILIQVVSLCGLVPLLHAQLPPTVRIDPHFRNGQQVAPFDHMFYLLVPVDTTLQTDELTQLNLYSISGTRRNPNKDFHILKLYFLDQATDTVFVDTPKEAGIKYLKILIDTKLEPYTRFSVILVLKPSHAYGDQFNAINERLYGKDIDGAQQKYKDLVSGLTVKYSSTPVVWPPFERYQRFFEDSLRSLYIEVDEEDSAILNNMNRLRDTIKSTGFKISDLFERSRQKDVTVNKFLSDSTKLLIPLVNLLNLPRSLRFFASGQLNMQEFEPYKLSKKIDLDKRIGNLSRLKAALTMVSLFFQGSPFSAKISDSVIDGIRASVQHASAIIDSRIETLTNAKKAIRQRLNSMKGLGGADVSFGGTSPTGEDLQTASGHYFIPDFGLANALTFVNHQAGYTVRPYLGVNVSFTAIDKSQRLKFVGNRWLLHRLSFVMGLTTTPLTRQGTSDLIKSMSVVTGLAFRLSTEFRVTGGVLIYQRNNANPDLPQQVTVGPMLALSLDLDVAKWFGDLKGKIF
jgi:hypothetical protein